VTGNPSGKSNEYPTIPLGHSFGETMAVWYDYCAIP
jgi:hypothetical protein